LRRSVQGSVRFSAISVAVYPGRSEGSHTCTTIILFNNETSNRYRRHLFQNKRS